MISNSSTQNQKIKTLVVDDEELGQIRMQQLLEDESEFVVSGICSGGQDAIDWLLEHRCDLVFLDIQMPEVDGFAVV